MAILPTQWRRKKSAGREGISDLCDAMQCDATTVFLFLNFLVQNKDGGN